MGVTEEAKKFLELLRYMGEKNVGKRGKPPHVDTFGDLYLEDMFAKAADLIESLSKQLDDQTVVIDRIYKQCKTLQSDLKELGFDSIADMYVQLEQTENKLSELLSYATGGRFSKADYSIDDMRRFVDDYNQSTCNECDQLEQVTNERDGLNIMLAQAQAMLETRTKERDAAVEAVKKMGACNYCIHDTFCKEVFPDCMNCKRACPCHSCSHQSNWQWRGAEVEG